VDIEVVVSPTSRASWRRDSPTRRRGHSAGRRHGTLVDLNDSIAILFYLFHGVRLPCVDAPTSTTRAGGIERRHHPPELPVLSGPAPRPPTPTGADPRRLLELLAVTGRDERPESPGQGGEALGRLHIAQLRRKPTRPISPPGEPLRQGGLHARVGEAAQLAARGGRLALTIVVQGAAGTASLRRSPVASLSHSPRKLASPVKMLARQGRQIERSWASSAATPCPRARIWIIVPRPWGSPDPHLHRTGPIGEYDGGSRTVSDRFRHERSARSPGLWPA